MSNQQQNYKFDSISDKSEKLRVLRQEFNLIDENKDNIMTKDELRHFLTKNTQYEVFDIDVYDQLCDQMKAKSENIGPDLFFKTWVEAEVTLQNKIQLTNTFLQQAHEEKRQNLWKLQEAQQNEEMNGVFNVMKGSKLYCTVNSVNVDSEFIDHKQQFPRNASALLQLDNQTYHTQSWHKYFKHHFEYTIQLQEREGNFVNDVYRFEIETDQNDKITNPHIQFYKNNEFQFHFNQAAFSKQQLQITLNQSSVIQLASENDIEMLHPLRELLSKIGKTILVKLMQEQGTIQEYQFNKDQNALKMLKKEVVGSWNQEQKQFDIQSGEEQLSVVIMNQTNEYKKSSWMSVETDTNFFGKVKIPLYPLLDQLNHTNKYQLFLSDSVRSSSIQISITLQYIHSYVKLYSRQNEQLHQKIKLLEEDLIDYQRYLAQLYLPFRNVLNYYKEQQFKKGNLEPLQGSQQNAQKQKFQVFNEHINVQFITLNKSIFDGIRILLFILLILSCFSMLFRPSQLDLAACLLFFVFYELHILDYSKTLFLLVVFILSFLIDIYWLITFSSPWWNNNSNKMNDIRNQESSMEQIALIMSYFQFFLKVPVAIILYYLMIQLKQRQFDSLNINPGMAYNNNLYNQNTYGRDSEFIATGHQRGFVQPYNSQFYPKQNGTLNQSMMNQTAPYVQNNSRIY